jgi:hypothetical protein
LPQGRIKEEIDMRLQIRNWKRIASIIVGFFILATPVWLHLLPSASAANNFVLVRLPNSVQVEIPRNWELLSSNRRVTLDSAVQSRNESAGLFDASSDLQFAANHYDDAGKNDALVNVRYYPDIKITQQDARASGQSDVQEIDATIRDVMTKSAQVSGFSLLAWFGTKIQTINGITAFVTEYKRSPAKDNGNFRVRLVRVFNGAKSFTLTISYRDDQEYLLRPICDRVISSLRI